MLELVGVVLQDPELRGRLLLHVLGRAVHRLVGPRVVGPGRPLEVVAPLPALARHPCGQVLLQRLDAPVHHGNGVAVLGPAGSSRSSVANSLPRSVVTTKFPLSPVSSFAARLVARPTVSAFLFCRGSTAASRVKTSITTRPYFVFPRVFWRPTCPARAAGAPAHLAHVGLQRFEGHGLRHVEVALPCESVQLPRVPHVEVVGQVPQRLHL